MRFADRNAQMNGWFKVCSLEDVPRSGAHIVRWRFGEVALIRRGERVLALAVSFGCVVVSERGCARTYRVTLEQDGSVLLEG
jgi:hypothetical protein